MLFHFFIWISEHPPRADKSAPTDDRMIVLKASIAPHMGIRLERNT
jgi:hypothetical protein